MNQPLSARITTFMLALLLTGLCLVSCSANGKAAPAAIRVNQVGYAVGEAKFAYVMGDENSLTGAQFEVLDEKGKTSARGGLGPSLGSWNSRYNAVHAIDLSSVDRTGTYQLRLLGSAAPGQQPARFRVATARQLLDPLRKNSVSFFRTQRDGKDVLAEATGRVPSHSADKRARVYAFPRPGPTTGRANAAALSEIGGPVDVSGGWFDAGDFLKFTHTTSYVVAQMWSTVRDAPSVPGLREEARHGLRWLEKMWDAETGTLYAQVGLGGGDEQVHGDHDVWRLPEEDDRLSVDPGDADYLVKYRPVFRVNEPGAPISPNIAGRMSAAFALAAQNEAEQHPAEASRLLGEAAALYAKSDIRHHGALVTTFPPDFYPEDSWYDDMEWAAIELSRAADALGDQRRSQWNRDAVRWARAYIRAGRHGILGLSDVSALAHADVLTSTVHDEGVTAALTADLRRQVETGRRQAARDSFRSGVVPGESDAASNTFGLLATARIYERVTGDHRFDEFAAQQLAWVFGANAWGSSFVIGAGDVFPHCPQHQVANLAMSHTGRGDILRGAVVNGPNDADLVSDREPLDGVLPCSFAPTGRSWSAFDGHGAAYVDEVASWQTVEPANDFTSTALHALSLETVQ